MSAASVLLVDDGQEETGLLIGSLACVSVPNLFQVVTLLGIDPACIRLERRDGARGEVYIDGRTVVHAATGCLTGAKAFFRMLGWGEGRFRVDRGEWHAEPSVGVGFERCLLQGLANLDECRALRRQLAAGSFVAQAGPQLASRQFQNNTAHVLALIEIHQDLDRVLDETPLSDLDCLRIVSELQDTGVIAPRRALVAAEGA